tara:strand:+ start:1418 stop:2149 length:732 start_codon:yes stop_codon:yes gene_type:complete
MATGKPGKKPSYTYQYRMMSVAVDCVIFGFDEGGLHVLLIERGEEPFLGKMALPGGFVRAEQEDLETAARRELAEETQITVTHLEQLYTYGHPDRDPREEHVISVSYFALVNRVEHHPVGGTDARAAHWIPLEEATAMDLAFDHATIVKTAVERLFAKLEYDPLGFKLLPSRFPLRDVQRLYEIAQGKPVDKRNFRKKLSAMQLLRETGETESDVRHRAAMLYEFNWDAYKSRKESGDLDFSL